MASHARTPVPAGSGSCPTPPSKRPGGGTILTLANGVLAGVGGVYVSTHSVLITLIAASAAIVLAAMVLFPRR